MNNQTVTKTYQTNFKATITSKIHYLGNKVTFKVLPTGFTDEIELVAHFGTAKHIKSLSLTIGDLIITETSTSVTGKIIYNNIKYIKRLKHSILINDSGNLIEFRDLIKGIKSVRE